jgi:hypothetical protein
MTYTLIGRGGVHSRDVSSHQYIGFLDPYGCSGRIWTVPVLTTETARTGPVPGSERDTAVEAFMDWSSVLIALSGADPDQAGIAPRACQ